MYYREIYKKGFESFEDKVERFMKLNPDWGHEDDHIGDIFSTTIRRDIDIAYDLEIECAEDAYLNDGHTRIGQCTVEETYFLIVEHYGEDAANEYLEEIEYYELGAVA